MAETNVNVIKCINNKQKHCGIIECVFHKERSLYHLIQGTTFINKIEYLKKSINNRNKPKSPFLIKCYVCSREVEYNGQKILKCTCQDNVDKETEIVSKKVVSNIKETVHRIILMSPVEITFVPNESDDYFKISDSKKTLHATCSICNSKQRVYTEVFKYMQENKESCPFGCMKNRPTDKKITIGVEQLISGKRR
jgi:hypothetical protein